MAPEPRNPTRNPGAKSDRASVRYGWLWWRTDENFDKRLADFDRSMAKRKREEEE